MTHGYAFPDDISGKLLENCLRMIECLAARADLDARCPQNDQWPYFGVEGWQRASQTLIAAKIIRIEITQNNFKTVWICKGPHAGKHTRLPPRLKGGIEPKPRAVYGASARPASGYAVVAPV